MHLLPTLSVGGRLRRAGRSRLLDLTVSPAIDRALKVLLGRCNLLLPVACANKANLVMTRAAERSPEHFAPAGAHKRRDITPNHVVPANARPSPSLAICTHLRFV
jgi:hypothetical protein